MKMKMMSGWFAVIVILASAGSLVAHHSLAQFDTTTAVWVKGAIARVELVNPHSIIFVDQKGADGQIQRWAVEGPGVVQLTRMGIGKEAMKVGDHIEACGYVLKDSPSAQLVAAVRDICRGGSYLSPRMLSQLVDDFRSRIKSANRLPRFATLTTREREVLKMLAEGNSVKEIACDLNLSVKTVEAHKFNLMRKLDIHNKAQLVQYAIQKKIIKIPNMV